MPASLRAESPAITSIFPDFPRAEKLVVIRAEADGCPFDRWLWIRALQGLVNREAPCVYILRESSAPERHWLSYYRERFDLPVAAELTPEGFLAAYKDCAKGYVVYDTERVLQTQNIAVTMCGLYGYLPVAPCEEALMQAQGLKRIDDLRGRFATDWDAAEWAIDHLWPLCNRRMIANCCIHRPSWYALSHELIDYIVYNRVFAIDLPKSRIYRRSVRLFERMMETAEAPGVLLNWHCVWDQEKEYIVRAARCGFFALCSTSTPNMTLHGGVGDPEANYVQPLPKRESCVAERDKVYVCLYNSDGDAPWAMHSLHSENWLDKDRGAFKFGWGFLPLTCKMMPAMMRYYHETKLENDCFFGPSSGAGYTYSWAWPEDLRDVYLSESRRLLTQSGQNGSYMVNWYLQEYWREVEDDAAVQREQELLADGAPGLICGLGGSPYAKSYPKGRIPKVHSVHIANVGNDNIGDIIRFAEECPTRPCFMFLFAQISPGIFNQLNGEMETLAQHPEIELLSMDEFFLTMQDAVARGMVGDELYEKTDALAETWLKAPGRHRLPLYERLCAELVDTVRDTPARRRERFAAAGYTQLVSGEIEGIAANRDSFINMFAGRSPTTKAEEADELLYTVFTVAWGVIRSVLEANGIYANYYRQCLSDFERLCGDMPEAGCVGEIFAAWDGWEEASPPPETSIAWCERLSTLASALNERYGDEGEFSGWPPKTI